MHEGYVVNRVLLEKASVCFANAFPLIVRRTRIIIAAYVLSKGAGTTIGENRLEGREDLGELDVLARSGQAKTPAHARRRLENSRAYEVAKDG